MGENNLSFWLLRLPAEPSPRLTQLGDLETRKGGTGADLLQSTFTLDQRGSTFSYGNWVCKRNCHAFFTFWYSPSLLLDANFSIQQPFTSMLHKKHPKSQWYTTSIPGGGNVPRWGLGSQSIVPHDSWLHPLRGLIFPSSSFVISEEIIGKYVLFVDWAVFSTCFPPGQSSFYFPVSVSFSPSCWCFVNKAFSRNVWVSYLFYSMYQKPWPQFFLTYALPPAQA